MTELRITVRNTSDAGGTFLTPVYFGFHDGAFDLFDAGEAASPGLEAIAEDGVFDVIAQERQAASPDSQGLVVAGAAGPIATQEIASATLDVDGSVNQFASFGAMILPSNDAFIGSDDAVQLFDDAGRFLGAQTIVFDGADVYDAGTEQNTELDAAFINQAGPNQGVTENGVIRLHEGFNGSEGNPDGVLGNPDGEPGAQIILGGQNAFGVDIDAVAADFTRDGAQIAEVHINTVVERNGGDGRDFIFGGRDDDIVNANGGRDVIKTGAGWDVVNAGRGADIVFGGRGADILNGEEGRDVLRGGADDDVVNGGAGRDSVFGGAGNDVVNGGTGNDILSGNRGDDMFVFAGGDGHDIVTDFDRRGDDVFSLSVDGVSSFEDVLDAASEVGRGVQLDFGRDGSIFLARTDLADLDEGDFIFA